MNNLPKLAVVAGIGFFGLRAFGNPLMSLGNPLNNTVQYQVEWSGNAGAKLFGSYVISLPHNLSTPTQVEKVTATLPHKVSFSAPENAIIAASGGTLNQGQVEVKIYKNGSECGTAAFTGSGAMANKVCQ